MQGKAPKSAAECASVSNDAIMAVLDVLAPVDRLYLFKLARQLAEQSRQESI